MKAPHSASNITLWRKANGSGLGFRLRLPSLKVECTSCGEEVLCPTSRSGLLMPPAVPGLPLRLQPQPEVGILGFSAAFRSLRSLAKDCSKELSSFQLEKSGMK